MKYIVLILIGLSSLSVAEFTKSSDVVTDDITGLYWQDDTVGTTHTWEEAIALCEVLSLDSITDWRLPNKVELLTLVDDSKSTPSLNAVFEETSASSYWTSTSYVHTPYNAWTISFAIGITESIDKSASAYVRCVRSD